MRHKMGPPLWKQSSKIGRHIEDDVDNPSLDRIGLFHTRDDLGPTDIIDIDMVPQLRVDSLDPFQAHGGYGMVLGQKADRLELNWFRREIRNIPEEKHSHEHRNENTESRSFHFFVPPLR